MFGMGMGELIIVAVVALLALGPDRLPGAAKKIGKTIRDLRKQTSSLKRTIEQDSQLGDAMKEIKQAFRDDPFRDEPRKRPKPKKKKKSEGEKAEGEKAEGEKAEGEKAEAEEAEVEGEDEKAEAESEKGEGEGEDPDDDSDEDEDEGDEDEDEDDDDDEFGPRPSKTVFVEPANADTVATEPRNINMSEFQKYVHMWGPQAAAEKYGTSQEEAEAAIEAVVSQAKRDSDA